MSASTRPVTVRTGTGQEIRYGWVVEHTGLEPAETAREVQP